MAKTVINCIIRNDSTLATNGRASLNSKKYNIKYEYKR
jgi:hypothetical protein